MSQDMNREELLRKLAIEKEVLRRLQFNITGRIIPVKKQWEFWNNLAQEKILSGLNQGGKSTAGKIKLSMDLTGLYPNRYTGRRFTHPIIAACGGKTANTTRDHLVDGYTGNPELSESTRANLNLQLQDAGRRLGAGAEKKIKASLEGARLANGQVPLQAFDRITPEMSNLERVSRRHMRGSFGDGGGSFEIETVNGSVKILPN